jgi:hypothetical protein
VRREGRPGRRRHPQCCREAARPSLPSWDAQELEAGRCSQARALTEGRCQCLLVLNLMLLSQGLIRIYRRSKTLWPVCMAFLCTHTALLSQLVLLQFHLLATNVFIRQSIVLHPFFRENGTSQHVSIDKGEKKIQKPHVKNAQY